MNYQRCEHRERQLGKQCFKISYKHDLCQDHYEDALYRIMKTAIREPLPQSEYALINEMNDRAKEEGDE